MPFGELNGYEELERERYHENMEKHGKSPFLIGKPTINGLDRIYHLVMTHSSRTGKIHHAIFSSVKASMALNFKNVLGNNRGAGLVHQTNLLFFWGVLKKALFFHQPMGFFGHPLNFPMFISQISPDLGESQRCVVASPAELLPDYLR